MPAWVRWPRCTIASAPASGQVVDAAIYESVLNMMESLVTEFDQLGHVRERSGPILPRIAPSNVYPTRDGIVMIGANQDTVFARLCEAMQAPGARDRCALPRSPGARRAPARARRDHRATGPPTLGTRELLALLEKHGVPSGLIYRAADMLDDPHFAARQAIVTHAASAVRHSCACRTWRRDCRRRPSSIRTPAPELGQHNDEVYRRLLGLDADALGALRAARRHLTATMQKGRTFARPAFRFIR